MNTAEIVRVARESRGLTRKQLSDKSGVHVTTIWNIERAKSSPSMDNMLKLMEAMDYTIVFNPRYKGGYMDE